MVLLFLVEYLNADSQNMSDGFGDTWCNTLHGKIKCMSICLHYLSNQNNLHMSKLLSQSLHCLTHVLHYNLKLFFKASHPSSMFVNPLEFIQCLEEIRGWYMSVSTDQCLQYSIMNECILILHEFSVNLITS